MIETPMHELTDPESMSIEDIKTELRNRGHSVPGNPSRKTLVDRLKNARAGGPLDEKSDEDGKNDEKENAVEESNAAGRRVTFIKTVPCGNYTLILESAKYIRDADGRTIGKEPGRRIRFDKAGRFTTDDAELIECIKKSRAFMNSDARSQIKILDLAAKARELREAASALERASI